MQAYVVDVAQVWVYICLSAHLDIEGRLLWLNSTHRHLLLFSKKLTYLVAFPMILLVEDVYPSYKGEGRNNTFHHSRA